MSRFLAPQGIGRAASFSVEKGVSTKAERGTAGARLERRAPAVCRQGPKRTRAGWVLPDDLPAGRPLCASRSRTDPLGDLHPAARQSLLPFGPVPNLGPDAGCRSGEYARIFEFVNPGELETFPARTRHFWRRRPRFDSEKHRRIFLTPLYSSLLSIPPAYPN